MPARNENLNDNRTLKAEVIVQAVRTLADRIEERFGERGLTRAGRDLTAIAERAVRRTRKIMRAYWGLRLLAYFVLGLGALGLWQLHTFYVVLIGGRVNILEYAQGLEATLNILLISALLVVFIMGLESRLKRWQALKGLHELRSIAHVIDMHQLTKDPSSALFHMEPTKSSPQRDLSVAAMVKYLDYCSEMLSLTAKLAALYAEQRRDAVVIEAVNDVETLTTSLSRKIWQKISIIREEAHYKAAAGPRSFE